MTEILVVDPENYEGLEEELDELGLGYDAVDIDEASEASLEEYDVVVSPGDDDLYCQAVASDVPFLAYDPSGNATDRLMGEPVFDANRIGAYAGLEGLDSYSRDIGEVIGRKDDMDLFLDMLSHDVRNDVNVALSYLNLMDIEENDQERYGVIKDKLSCIEEIIESVETLRELEEPKMDDQHLSGIFARLESDYAAEAVEEGFDLDFEIEGENITVSAGPLLEDMYGQIISNAFNHSEGSEVQVTAIDADMPKVIIEDDGKGIPDSIADKLFQKGVKGQKTGNTGIGTALVDRIADRYEIDIDVGESDMGGAKFTMHHQSGGLW